MYKKVVVAILLVVLMTLLPSGAFAQEDSSLRDSILLCLEDESQPLLDCILRATQRLQAESTNTDVRGTEVSNSSSTNTAPQTWGGAAELLNVSEDALTPLYPSPGDPTVIGWVVGFPSYRTQVEATVPSGTCLDFAEGRTTSLAGSFEWLVRYRNADWLRGLTAGEMEIVSSKATIYWTPCERGDGVAPGNLDFDFTEVAAQEQESGSQSTAETDSEEGRDQSCTPPDNTGDWERLEEGCGWSLPEGTETRTVRIAEGYRLDLPDDQIFGFEEVEGVEGPATVWRLDE